MVRVRPAGFGRDQGGWCTEEPGRRARKVKVATYERREEGNREGESCPSAAALRYHGRVLTNWGSVVA
jgi:hypothetical protein